MASNSHSNFNICIDLIQALVEYTIPCLQHAVDTWHYQTKQTIRQCATPNQCPQNKKPSAKNNACPECIAWVTAIEQEVYPHHASGSLQWPNVNPTVFFNDPLEVIKLFVLRIPAKKTFSVLSDFDAASILMIMSKFKAFHGGDHTVFEKIQKVFHMRNLLAHLKVGQKLELDDQTFGPFWKDITRLVDALESLGRQYFTQQTADELRQKIIEIKTNATQAQLDKDSVRPIVKDIVLESLQTHLFTVRESLSGSSSGIAELCRVNDCEEEVFVACPFCTQFLCQRHFVEDSPCHEHTKVKGIAQKRTSNGLSYDAVILDNPDSVSQGQLNVDEDISRKQQAASSSNDNEALDETVQIIAADLRKYYLNSYCKKQMYPWKPGNYVDLDKIYVPVTIDITIPGMRPIKERLKSYQEIFQSNEDTRFIMTGNPGQGKSTFCAKLAFDWCQELSPLKDVKLLFIIQLARVDHSSDIEDAIRSQLLSKQSSNDVDSAKLGEIISYLGEQIVIILDGLDEAPSDLFKCQTNGSLVEIIRFEQFRNCCVIVTTRPWREKEVRDIPGYRRLELQKMKRSEVKAYITKLFGQTPETIALGKKLLRYIDENRLLLDCSTPLMSLLISWYWTETNGEREIPDRISEVYDEIITIMNNNFMKTISNENRQIDNEDTRVQGLVERFLNPAFELLPSFIRERNLLLLTKENLYSQFGELALNGLTPSKTKIVFTEEQIKKSCGGKECINQLRDMGILCTKGKDLLQFFHKSGQEFFAGKYLQNNPKHLQSYIKRVTTIEDALSVAPVLVFASRSKLAAKMIVQRLMEILRSAAPLQNYYDENVSLDSLLSTQRYIELFLDCNFEADAEVELVSMLRDLFLDGKVLFHGISSKSALAVAYFMRRCDLGDISELTLRPVAHIHNSTVPFGLTEEMYSEALQRMKYLGNDKIQQIRNSFVEANSDLHERWITVYEPVELAAYIPCIQSFEGLPSSSETNIAPVVRSFKYTRLHTLDVRDFRLDSAFYDLIESMDKGEMSSLQELKARATTSTEQQTTNLVSMLPKLPMLKFFDISNNKAEAGQTIPILADNLNHLKALQVLYVRYMDAPADDMEKLAQKLPSQMTRLAVDGNGMSDAVAAHLVDTLPETLTVLRITMDELSENKHDELLHVLHTNCINLQNLGIWRSSYPPDFVKHGGLLLMACKDMTILILHVSEVLSIRNDSIPEESVELFVEGLQQAKNIKNLRLFGIHLDRKSFYDVLRLCRRKQLTAFQYSRDLLPEGVIAEELDDFVTLV